MKIIGYTADADCYCAECGEELYPGCRDTDVPDHGGNIVHPIFSTDEVPPHWCCSKCGEFIDVDGEILRMKDLYIELWWQYCEYEDMEIKRRLDDAMDAAEIRVKELEAKRK